MAIKRANDLVFIIKNIYHVYNELSRFKNKFNIFKKHVFVTFIDLGVKQLIKPLTGTNES